MSTHKSSADVCPCGSGLAYAACCGRFLDAHALPDRERVEIAVREIGEHGDALIETHIGDRIRCRHAATQHAEAVDHALTAGGDPPRAG